MRHWTGDPALGLLDAQWASFIDRHDLVLAELAEHGRAPLWRKMLPSTVRDIRRLAREGRALEDEMERRMVDADLRSRP